VEVVDSAIARIEAHTSKINAERACEEKGLNLYVLPPKRPQLNGAVERCNGSWRYEFYAASDLPHPSTRCSPSSMLSPSLQPSKGHTTPSTVKLQPSI
jgi:transposase InsO family protein